MKELTPQQLAVFEDKKIRRTFDEKKQIWLFSIVDIVSILINRDYQTARNYWKVLKTRLNKEGSIETVTNCNQLKLLAEDGKMRLTDVADAQTLFRIIQSIPSPKAEPIKQWLAKMGYERIQETVDPEIALNRARKTWQQHGRTQKWIQQRILGQETRNKLTDYWHDHNISDSKDFAKLTNIIHQEWSDISIKQHKKLKGLKNQNLRDHMTEAELIFTALAELSTRQIAQSSNATGVEENTQAGIAGGKIAKKARQELEAKTGKKVISKENFLTNDNVNEKLDKGE